MRDRVAIAGGRGFIGMETAKQLTVAGFAVFVWGRDGRWIYPTKPKVVINAIRPGGIREAYESSKKLQARGVPIVTLSSDSIFYIPPSRYSLSKLVQEVMLKKNGIILRLPHVWGSVNKNSCVLDKWKMQAENGETLIVNEPGRKIDFVHVRDVAAMLVRIVERGEFSPCLINVCSDNGWPELLTLALIVGKKVEVREQSSVLRRWSYQRYMSGATRVGVIAAESER